MRLNESTVRNSIRHGNNVAHHARDMALRFWSMSLTPGRRRGLDAEAEERQGRLGGDERCRAR